MFMNCVITVSLRGCEKYAHFYSVELFIDKLESPYFSNVTVRKHNLRLELVSLWDLLTMTNCLYMSDIARLRHQVSSLVCYTKLISFSIFVFTQTRIFQQQSEQEMSNLR